VCQEWGGSVGRRETERSVPNTEIEQHAAFHPPDLRSGGLHLCAKTGLGVRTQEEGYETERGTQRS
jgi:hypothetical protein